MIVRKTFKESASSTTMCRTKARALSNKYYKLMLEAPIHSHKYIVYSIFHSVWFKVFIEEIKVFAEEKHKKEIAECTMMLREEGIL